MLTADAYPLIWPTVSLPLLVKFQLVEPGFWFSTTIGFCPHAGMSGTIRKIRRRLREMCALLFMAILLKGDSNWNSLFDLMPRIDDAITRHRGESSLASPVVHLTPRTVRTCAERGVTLLW
jgi:hypothetical protein